MVTGGPTGSSHITQYGSLGDRCPNLIQRRAIHVCIHGGDPIGMFDLDHVAISGIVTGFGNGTIGRTINFRSAGGRNIDTGMVTLFLSGNRMDSVSEVGGDVAFPRQRPL